MDLNKIYNENCLDTMARMSDGFIDLTVTSPPYDNLRQYNGYSFPFKEIAQELFRVTQDGGVVIWVVNDKTSDGDETGTSFRQALYFKECKFKLWDTMIFGKKNCFPGDIGKRYKQMFEYIFVLVKGKEPNSFNPIQVPTTFAGTTFNAARLERDGRNYLHERSGLITVADTKNAGNIFTYATGFAVGLKQDLGAFKHPAVFPEELARDQIASWSNPNDIVYDPFMGSGTTAKAAHQLQRRWIGSEISSEYVELANKRLEPYLAQESLFQVTG